MSDTLSAQHILTKTSLEKPPYRFISHYNIHKIDKINLYHLAAATISARLSRK